MTARSVRPLVAVACTLSLLIVSGVAHADDLPALLAPPVVSPPPAPEVTFAWGDTTWMNGQSRQKTFPLGSIGNAVTPSIYLDVNYAFSHNRPRDNTLTGSASVGRHNEVGINLASIGLEWSYQHVIGRASVQYGNMLNIVQDLDGTVARDARSPRRTSATSEKRPPATTST